MTAIASQLASLVPPLSPYGLVSKMQRRFFKNTHQIMSTQNSLIAPHFMQIRNDGPTCPCVMGSSSCSRTTSLLPFPSLSLLSTEASMLFLEHLRTFALCVLHGLLYHLLQVFARINFLS